VGKSAEHSLKEVVMDTVVEVMGTLVVQMALVVDILVVHPLLPDKLEGMNLLAKEYSLHCLDNFDSLQIHLE
jgi:hypothetical protein